MKSPKIKYLLTAAALCAAGSLSQASVVLHNTGTTGGWSRTLVEHNGSLGNVSSPVYKGSTAIKATQVYDSSYTGRYHSECITSNGYTRGQTRFYGFAFMLPSNWQTVSQGYNICQMGGDLASTGCDDFSPTTMFWITNSSLNTRRKSGTPCAQVITNYNGIASVSKGVWHRVVLHANWQSTSTGFFRVYFNGSNVLDKTNVATTYASSVQCDFRVGLYANGWHDSGSMTGTQGTRTVYYDQIGIATTMAEADPAGW